jgi:PAS domain S-box-containing protein
MLMGVLVLIGWHLEIGILTTFIPGVMAMNPITATCFIGSAIAIFLLSRDDENIAIWINCIGYALLFIGLLKSGQLLEFWDIHPDFWLYGERVNQDIQSGKLSNIVPITTLNIMMQGAALLSRNIGRKGSSVPSQFLLAVQGFTALVALLSYFYGARAMNDFGSFRPMSLPSSLAFLMLTTGMLLAMPDRGVMKLLINQGEAGHVNQRLLLSGLLAPLLLGWFVILGQRAGWYTPLLSIAIFCMAATVCFIALTLLQGARLIEMQHDRSLQENQIRESEERFKFLADSAFEGIIICVDDIVIDANNQFCQMMGYSIHEVIGMRNSDFAIPEMRDDTIRAITENKESASHSTGLRKDGSHIELEISARPIRIEGKKARVTAIRDITKRHQMEKMKDEFVSVVSHELRTPLTSIHGALSLMANGVAGPLSEPAQAMVDVASRNTRRLLALINDLLDIQKIEAGKMAFRKINVDLTALIETTLQSMHSYSEGLEVRFEFTPPPQPIWVNSDPDRLTQVLTNLLSNAAKFSPSHGCVQITLQRISKGDNSESVEVSVIDEGPGIPLEFHDRIFQKFAQADSSSTRQASGTGLGLSICKAVMDRLGGTIDFHSEKGKGTTFFFQLPLPNAHNDETPQNSNSLVTQSTNFN